MLWQPWLVVLVAYLVGAIPTGYIMGRMLKGIDIREHGSGNVGATNVKRVLGAKAGYATLALDFLKGLLPVWASMTTLPPTWQLDSWLPVLVGLAVVIGHSRSIYIGFSGGKSVISSLGVLIALQPIPALILAGISISIIKISRYVSLGSITGAALLPLAVWLNHGPQSHLILGSFMAVYVIYLHRGNIQRLMTHQENRL